MMKNPRVSIVIACWNSGVYLPRCLDSLVAQTFRDFEVIVVDNGSTDGSLNSLEANESSLQIRVERLSKNIGFAAANNIGARLAGGKWLVLLMQTLSLNRIGSGRGVWSRGGRGLQPMRCRLVT